MIKVLYAPFLLVPCLMAASVSANPGTGTATGQTATAVLRAPDGSVKGNVRAVQTKAGIRVLIEGEQLPPGLHGAHVHMVGTCASPDFSSAGGHWNPTGLEHGHSNPKGMHMGDLPNLLVGPQGQGRLDFIVLDANIAGGASAMLDSDGAAIVIHAGPDDLATDPSGNSGGRIACGVFAAG